MEQIESTLAIQNWMEDSEYRHYVNKIAVEISVKFGNVSLGVWSKLDMMYDQISEYVSLQSFIAGHDLCRVQDILDSPAGSPVTLQDVCSNANAGTSECTTGVRSDVIGNPNCRCNVINNCATDGYIVIYLNRSKDFSAYKQSLKNAVSSKDLTCGGLPVGLVPNNYSLGIPCATSQDCAETKLGGFCGSSSKPCYCCSNITHRCSADSDCAAFAADSYCGCVPGVAGNGICGPYYTVGGQLLVYNKASGGYPALTQRYGTPCMYISPPSSARPTDQCLPGAYLKVGSQAQAVVEPLTVNGFGSPVIKFFGALDDVNRALAAISYKTRPYYNRLYRPPFFDRPVNFDVTVDSVDTLTVSGDDLGNSDGGVRNIQQSNIGLRIRTRAVNNAPYISLPASLSANEDLSQTVNMDINDANTKIITVDSQGSIYLWDLRDTQPVNSILNAHGEMINAVAMTLDDSKFVTCSGAYELAAGKTPDRSIRVWDTSAMKQLIKMPLATQTSATGHILGITCVAINYAGTMIISGGYDHAVIFWDISTGKQLSKQGGLTMLNGTLVQPFRGHKDVVTAVALYDIPVAGSLVQRGVSCSDDMSCRIYDLTDSLGNELVCIGPASAGCNPAYPTAHTGPITSIAILNVPERRILITGSEDKLIMIWDLNTYKRIRVLTGHIDQVLSLSTVSAAKLLGRVAAPILVSVGGFRSPYNRQTFKLSGDTSIHMWDLETGNLLNRYEITAVHFAGKPVTKIALSSDGSRIITASEDGKVATWSSLTGDLYNQIPCPCLCPAVLVSDPWSRCQQAPCRPGCSASPVFPLAAVNGFALFNNPIKIQDPDSNDYGFSSKKFLLNITVQHGRVHYLEALILQEKRCSNDGSLCIVNKDCVADNGDNGLCLFQEAKVAPLRWSNWPPPVGLHALPSPVMGYGNQELSIEGTMDALNTGLARLMYLGNPNYNSRTFIPEYMQFDFNDQGAISDNYAKSFVDARLQGTGKLNVLVESINDPPVIGIKWGTSAMTVVQDANTSRCMTIPPASAEYFLSCDPAKRTYIDIDEDTLFTVTPNILWIEDVDSNEAIDIAKQGRPHYLCSDPLSVDGCTCNQGCLCGQGMCKCDSPLTCDSTSYPPGRLLIEMQVTQGKLTIAAPPGRNDLPIIFLQNLTASYDSIHACLKKTLLAPQCYKVCANQLSCSINQSSIAFFATRDEIQTILSQKYMVYVGNPNFYGKDNLLVWVADQGFTDEWYDVKGSYSAAASSTIMIRVVGVNDPPVIAMPGYVFSYSQGLRCYVDWMQNQNKQGIRCPADVALFQNASRVPPLAGASSTSAFNYLRTFGRLPFLSVSDVDMDDTPYGNMTLDIQIGRAGTGQAGRFTISKLVPSLGYYMFYDEQDTSQVRMLRVKGRMQSINVILERLYYDADPTFQGYAPFIVKATDNNNFGECSGNHKCGMNDPCDDGTTAQPHAPSIPSQGRANLDVVIGGVSLCQAGSCETCVGDCGWCHSHCGGKGKCMIGKGKPIFESCQVNSLTLTYLAYGVCSATLPPWLQIGIILGVGFLFSTVGGYLFVRWAARRHGSVKSYLRKKRRDAKRIGRLLHVWPPDDADYLQFFLTLLFIAAAFVILTVGQQQVNLLCSFQSEFYLDTASSITLELDKCDLRFLPANPSIFPKAGDNQVRALKVKFAYLKHPLVELQSLTCSASASIKVVNSRPSDVKYVDYYCNVIVIVPANFILPEMVIQDFSGFTSSIRAGSMDQDSQDFAIDFGPNSFTILGTFINARFRGLSARSFNFDVTSGYLLAEQVSSLDPSSFRSVNADLTVTTPYATSVSFWQREANKVCLVAAKGSLYVQGSCEQVCAFLPSSAIRLNATNATTQAECVAATMGGVWDSASSTCTLQCPSLPRPLSPGCYDLNLCTVDESPQCLCKPSCDLVPAALLAYDGVSGVAGTCNLAGQCCRDICAGFSRADLHPIPDQPYNGIVVDPAKYNYVGGQLDQKFVFESQSGQITLEVGSASNLALSYKGSAPQSSVQLPSDIVTSDKEVLDLLFHPGGDNIPKQEIFTFGLSGPGVPETITGSFTWVKNIRYVVLQPWFLSVASFGLLMPSTLSSQSRINPSFCPHTVQVDSPAFNARLITIKDLITNSLVSFPPSQPPKPIPSSSVVVFKSVAGQDVIFYTDKTTGATRLEKFVSTNYSLLNAVVWIGVLFPGLCACYCTFLAFRGGRKYLLDFRRAYLNTRMLFENALMQHLRIQREMKQWKQLAQSDDDAKRQQAMKEIEKLKRAHAQEMENAEEAVYGDQDELIGSTNFFCMCEDFLGDLGTPKTLYYRMIIAVREVFIAVLPSVLPLYLSSIFADSWLQTLCESRPDKCTCLASKNVVVSVLQYLVYVFWIVILAELSLYHLQIPYRVWYIRKSPLHTLGFGPKLMHIPSLRQVLRMAFYLVYFFFLWLSLFLVLLSCFWIILGLIVISPAKSGPVVFSAGGVLSFFVLNVLKDSIFLTRVKNSVTKSVHDQTWWIKGKLGIPSRFVAVFTADRIEKAIKQNNISFPGLVIANFFKSVLLVLVYIFLFIGFSAFSEPTDPLAATLNLVITILVAIAAIQYARAVDNEELKEVTEELKRQIEIDLRSLYKFWTSQVQRYKRSMKVLQFVSQDLGEDWQDDDKK